MRGFGPVEVHYGKVQQKVMLKYDSWHRDILSRFGGLLGENMHEFHTIITKVGLIERVRGVYTGACRMVHPRWLRGHGF